MRQSDEEALRAKWKETVAAVRQFKAQPGELTTRRLINTIDEFNDELERVEQLEQLRKRPDRKGGPAIVG